VITMRDELISHVVLHSGLNPERAHAVLAAVVDGLRRQLGRPEAEALADQLPDELAAILRSEHYRGGSMAARVAAVEDVRMGQAIEHAASVMRAFADLLPGELLERLRRALPAETAALLEPTAPEAAEHPMHHHRDTLAEGRPGSRHPLSEAGPARGQADSVVESANPHGDTKLSSSRGLTQEREQESLGTGRPGARRSLADPDSE
jgi:uncharacterized protein (DUF2267 family)